MNNRQRIAAALTMAGVTFGAIALAGAQTPAPNGTAEDFSAATVAEVRDAQGQVLLTGKFVLVDEEDEDIERKATLTPTGIDPDASGRAEVEVDRDDPRVQEIELSVRNVAPSIALTFVIDGKVVGTVTSDTKGKVSYEREIPAPANKQTR